VLEIREMLKLLNNPHASINKCSENSQEHDIIRKHTLNPAEQPYGEIFEGIFYLKIPTMRGVELEILEKTFLEHEKESNGLIIDLRDNGGGQSKPGQLFAKKYFLNQGNHFISTRKKIRPEGEVDDIPMYVNSENSPIYKKPIVILTSNNTFSSAETFVSIMKTGSNATVIGTETRGGSAYPTHEYIEIDGVNYRVDIPICRVILANESKPIEETKITPDIYYDAENIVQYALKYIEKINKAEEEGERTKVTENVLKIAKQIDPENKLSGLELVEEVCRYIRTMTPSQETLEEAWKNNLIPKRDKWDTSADELLSESNLIPGHNRIRNIDGCTQISYITRALLLAKGIPSLIVDTIDKEWLENNPRWKNDNKSDGAIGHYFVDVYIPQDKKWYTINPGKREERIHEYGDYSVLGKMFIKMAEGRDTIDMGFNTMEERLDKLEGSLGS